MDLKLFKNINQIEKTKTPIQTTIRRSSFERPVSETASPTNSSSQIRFITPPQQPSSPFRSGSTQNTAVSPRPQTIEQQEPIIKKEPIPLQEPPKIQYLPQKHELPDNYDQKQNQNQIFKQEIAQPIKVVVKSNASVNTEEIKCLVKGTQIDNDLVKTLVKSTNTDGKFDPNWIKPENKRVNHFNEGFRIYYDNVGLDLSNLF